MGSHGKGKASLERGSPPTLYRIKGVNDHMLDMVGRGLELFDHTSVKKELLLLIFVHPEVEEPVGDCNSER